MVNRSEFFAFDFLKVIGDKGGREALLHRVLTVAEQQAELRLSNFILKKPYEVNISEIQDHKAVAYVCSVRGQLGIMNLGEMIFMTPIRQFNQHNRLCRNLRPQPVYVMIYFLSVTLQYLKCSRVIYKCINILECFLTSMQFFHVFQVVV